MSSPVSWSRLLRGGVSRVGAAVVAVLLVLGTLAGVVAVPLVARAAPGNDSHASPMTLFQGGAPGAISTAGATLAPEESSLAGVDGTVWFQISTSWPGTVELRLGGSTGVVRVDAFVGGGGDTYPTQALVTSFRDGERWQFLTDGAPVLVRVGVSDAASSASTVVVETPSTMFFGPEADRFGNRLWPVASAGAVYGTRSVVVSGYGAFGDDGESSAPIPSLWLGPITAPSGTVLRVSWEEISATGAAGGFPTEPESAQVALYGSRPADGGTVQASLAPDQPFVMTGDPVHVLLRALRHVRMTVTLEPAGPARFSLEGTTPGSAVPEAPVGAQTIMTLVVEPTSGATTGDGPFFVDVWAGRATLDAVGPADMNCSPQDNDRTVYCEVSSSTVTTRRVTLFVTPGPALFPACELGGSAGCLVLRVRSNVAGAADQLVRVPVSGALPSVVITSPQPAAIAPGSLWRAQIQVSVPPSSSPGAWPGSNIWVRLRPTWNATRSSVQGSGWTCTRSTVPVLQFECLHPSVPGTGAPPALEFLAAMPSSPGALSCPVELPSQAAARAVAPCAGFVVQLEDPGYDWGGWPLYRVTQPVEVGPARLPVNGYQVGLNGSWSTPANDDFDLAEDLPSSVPAVGDGEISVEGTTVNALDDFGDDFVDVWYRFTSPPGGFAGRLGYRVEQDFLCSFCHRVAAVRMGGDGSLTNAGGEQFPVPASSEWSYAWVEPGVTVWFIVSAKATETGPFRLKVRAEPNIAGTPGQALSRPFLGGGLGDTFQLGPAAIAPEPGLWSTYALTGPGTLRLVADSRGAAGANTQLGNSLSQRPLTIRLYRTTLPIAGCASWCSQAVIAADVSPAEPVATATGGLVGPDSSRYWRTVLEAPVTAGRYAFVVSAPGEPTFFEFFQSFTADPPPTTTTTVPSTTTTVPSTTTTEPTTTSSTTTTVPTTTSSTTTTEPTTTTTTEPTTTTSSTTTTTVPTTTTTSSTTTTTEPTTTSSTSTTTTTVPTTTTTSSTTTSTTVPTGSSTSSTSTSSTTLVPPVLRAELANPDQASNGDPIRVRLRWDGPTLQKTTWRVIVDGTTIMRGSGTPPDPWVVQLTELGPQDPNVLLNIPNGDGTEASYGTRVAIPTEVRRSQRVRPLARLVVTSVGPGTDGPTAVLAPSASLTGTGGVLTRWELAFGDGSVTRGEGLPPSSVTRAYRVPAQQPVLVVAMLTVWGRVPVAGKIEEVASLPAQALVRLEPSGPTATGAGEPAESAPLGIAPPSTGISVLFVRVDADGEAEFEIALGSALRADRVRSWSLTVGGEKATASFGNVFVVPARFAFAFEPVADDTERVVIAQLDLADGSVLTATLTIVLVPSDGPVPPTQELFLDRPVGAFRRDDADSDGEPGDD